MLRGTARVAHLVLQGKEADLNLGTLTPQPQLASHWAAPPVDLSAAPEHQQDTHGCFRTRHISRGAEEDEKREQGHQSFRPG